MHSSLSGLIIGIVIGFLARRGRLCTFGAVEDWVAGKDLRRFKTLALALAIAVLGTTALAQTGIMDLKLVRYLPPELPFAAIFLGGVLFGLGMALVGTCVFGSLIRLGSGDLRSLVTLLLFSAVAFATLRGGLFTLRSDFFESLRIAMPGTSQSSLPELLGHLFQSPDTMGVLTPLAVAGGLTFWALRGGELRRRWRLLMAGVFLGAAVVAAWFLSFALTDPFVSAPTPESLTFVAPVAKATFGYLVFADQRLDFGIATVFGVPLGSLLAALLAGEFRWDAFDDAREMKRHLAGAVLMGFGGVLAGGCTIGQGLTAGSLLALSWPLAVGGMILGARAGIAFLLTGL